MRRPTRREFLRAFTAAAMAPRIVHAQQRRVRTVAGTGKPASPSDDLWAGGADALQTPVTNPFGIVAGPDGALYWCELDTGCTRRMDLASRRVTTVAGNGKKAYAGDGGRAIAASFNAPHEIRFDP